MFLNQRNFRNVVGILAVICIPALLVYASSDSSCQSAWNQSEASRSCDAGGEGSSSAGYVEWRDSKQACVVSAFCDNGTPTKTYNQITGSTSDLRALKNCGGSLKERCS